ncbi:MAG: sulfatase [Planctomycetota bacterium]
MRKPRSVPLLVILLALVVCGRASAESTRPNFVVIFIDDMGYGDIGPFGSKINDTPALDRMAEEGMRLTSFYVGASVCTPSRAALMTGCYPRRVGLARGSGHVVLFPGDKHGLNPKELTVAELLKDASYRTGCFGKWHLGDQPEFLPTANGFDEYVGIPYSNDMWPGNKRWAFPTLPVMRGTKVVQQITEMKGQATLCRLFTEEACSFIKKNRERPFFVYVPHAYVHHPRAARPEFSKNASNVTEAQIEEVDWSVGRILDTLREEKLDRKTLVLFTSDNGGARGCVNKPLRGGKGSAWEGGVREPTIAWWPGTIPAGSDCHEILTAMDVMPTFCDLANAQVPSDRVIDGRSIVSLLKGVSGAKSPHEAYYYHQGETLKAVRSGDWKFFRNGALYQIKDDIGETRNVAKQNPRVVKRLEGLMNRFDSEIRRNARPVGVSRMPKTLVPRPGVSGPEAFTPTLDLGVRNRRNAKKKPKAAK